LCIKAGVSVNARAIAKGLHVSQPAVSKALPGLEKEEIVAISKDKDSKRLSIELNRENHKVVWLKRVENLRQIYESGLVQFLYDALPSATIILFGSYAFGEDTGTSDIDLAVIGSKEKNLDLARFENAFERTIIINYYKNSKDLDKKFLSNICNGIVLKGALEL
jgi:predicted nucleotidyltransferase